MKTISNIVIAGGVVILACLLISFVYYRHVASPVLVPAVVAPVAVPLSPVPHPDFPVMAPKALAPLTAKEMRRGLTPEVEQLIDKIEARLAAKALDEARFAKNRKAAEAYFADRAAYEKAFDNAILADVHLDRLAYWAPPAFVVYRAYGHVELAVCPGKKGHEWNVCAEDVVWGAGLYVLAVRNRVTKPDGRPVL
jgi:hypothetical protein